MHQIEVASLLTSRCTFIGDNESSCEWPYFYLFLVLEDSWSVIFLLNLSAWFDHKCILVDEHCDDPLGGTSTREYRSRLQRRMRVYLRSLAEDMAKLSIVAGRLFLVKKSFRVFQSAQKFWSVVYGKWQLI